MYHQNDESELQAFIRARVAEVSLDGPHHPTSAALLDYWAGDSSLEEREQVQDHLALCTRCAQEVLALEPPAEREVQPGVAGAESVEVAGAWRRLAGALRTAARRRKAIIALPYGLAAALLLAVLGLSLQTDRLRREIGSLSQPAAGAQIVDLVPEGSRRERTDPGVGPGGISPAAERIVLILNLGDPNDFAKYRVAIESFSGTEVWRSRTLSRAADGTLALTLDSRFLSPGSYRAWLSVPERGRWVRIARYPFRIEPVPGHGSEESLR